MISRFETFYYKNPMLSRRVSRFREPSFVHSVDEEEAAEEEEAEEGGRGGGGEGEGEEEGFWCQ